MKKLKGFTLVECLISLAVLAVASLVMAQIYASVGSINRQNHYMNTSLAAQMALVEQRDVDTETIKYNTTGEPVIFKRLSVNYRTDDYKFNEYYNATAAPGVPNADNTTPGKYLPVDHKYDVGVRALKRLDENKNVIPESFSSSNGSTERANYKYFEKPDP